MTSFLFLLASAQLQHLLHTPFVIFSLVAVVILSIAAIRIFPKLKAVRGSISTAEDCEGTH